MDRNRIEGAAKQVKGTIRQAVGKDHRQPHDATARHPSKG